MEFAYPIHRPSFYTATIQQWKPLLSDNRYKDIIVSSLQFLVREKRIEINAFAIMSNHLHLIWQPFPPYTPTEIQSSFMKFTAQQMKRLLEKDNPSLLAEYKSNKMDRDYHFWKRESLSIELFTPSVFSQKLDYIHYNPVCAGLCVNEEDYHYSLAKFYHSGAKSDDFGMMTHYM